MAQLTRLPIGIHINKPFQYRINCEKLAKIVERERQRERGGEKTTSLIAFLLLSGILIGKKHFDKFATNFTNLKRL